MNAAKFASELAKLAPSVEALQSIGLSRKEAEEFVRSFKPVKLSTESDDHNEIVNLVNGWDLRKVEIGMVRFSKKVKVTDEFIQFGVVEADPLVMLRDGGEVVVRELGAINHLLWRVAKDSSRFLDALLLAAGHLARCLTDEECYMDKVAVRATITKCTAAAGGNEYREFFMMLIGDE